MSDCIFCKIVAGEIPSMRIYEDDLTLAFLDVAKDVDGHILVIVKTSWTVMLRTCMRSCRQSRKCRCI